MAGRFGSGHPGQTRLKRLFMNRTTPSVASVVDTVRQTDLGSQPFSMDSETRLLGVLTVFVVPRNAPRKESDCHGGQQRDRKRNGLSPVANGSPCGTDREVRGRSPEGELSVPT